MQNGDRIGKFVLRSQLDAHLWHAERAEDFEQSVLVAFTSQPLTPESEAPVKERRHKMAHLDHAAIPKFLDAGATADGYFYNLFEEVPDQSVLEIAKTQHWELDKRLAYVAEVLEALSAAHAQLLTHGSLNPNCFCVTQSGHTRVAAFPADEPNGDSVHGDITAVVGLLVLLVSGAGRRKVPADVSAILRKSQTANSENGYASAYALAQDLRAYLAHRPVSARTTGPVHSALLFAQRRPRVFYPLVLVILIAIISASYSVVMEVHAQHARDQARARLYQLDQLTDSLESNIYQPVSQLPNSAEARETLIQWSSQSLDALTLESGDDAELRVHLAASYRRLAAVLRANQDEQAANVADAKAHLLEAKPQ
jgi:hypothetical protein